MMQSRCRMPWTTGPTVRKACGPSVWNHWELRCSSLPKTMQMRDSRKLSAKEMSRMRTRGSVLAVAAIACLLFHGTIAAGQAGQIIATFPTPAQATLSRLSNLDHLPNGTWRYHAADLAHG